MIEELTTLIYDHLTELGYNLKFDTPPIEYSENYIQFGPTYNQPKKTKSFLLGTMVTTLHFWYDYSDIRTVSKDIDNVATSCRYFPQPHNWVLNKSNSRIVTDETTNKKFRHGILELEYNYF